MKKSFIDRILDRELLVAIAFILLGATLAHLVYRQGYKAGQKDLSADVQHVIDSTYRAWDLEDKAAGVEYFVNHSKLQ